MKSSKHTNGVAGITKDKKQSQSIIDCLKRQDTWEHPSGSTLPVESHLFRFETIECVLSGGIRTPIKSGCFTSSAVEIWP